MKLSAKEKMKADSASHLLRQPVSFELFLFAYLACALVLQKINIYKTNFHLIDFNLVVFTLVILSRRFAWCALQEFQALWTKPSKPPPSKSSSGPSRGKKSSSNSGGGGGGGVASWWGLNLKRWMVVVCTLLVIAWSVGRLIQQTSLFNLLFLFYPLLLYLSLFGFTLEPRLHRMRYKPPKTFLQHIDFSNPERLGTHLLSSGRNLLMLSVDSTEHIHHSNDTSLHEGSANCTSNSNSPLASNSQSGSSSNQRNKTHSTTAQLERGNSSNGGDQYNDSASRNSSRSTEPQCHVHIYKVHVPDQHIRDGSSGSEHGEGSIENEVRYTWEYDLVLPATPDEIRSEVDVLLSDLIVRLKQILFNSILCAYYVGIIPMLFADSHLYYDKWWCVEHAFLVWANSFVILSSHLFPPSYCQILYRCALHLGCWTRCVHDENANTWSPDIIWPCDAVVQWNGESFRGEGLQNVAIPCHSSQECFYLLFHSRLNLHTWLLTMQCIIVAFQIVVLLRSVFWFQTLSMSVFLAFNYFIFYKLLYNRLWFRHTLWLT